jgi:UDP-N-acetylglucosamine 4,6-dehydratase
MSIFITGITGTLGSAIAEYYYTTGATVFGCARDEARIAAYKSRIVWDNRVFCLDAGNIDAALTKIADDDYGSRVTKVYHCAALKHVEHGESFPEEAVRQNLLVLERVIAACRRRGCLVVVPSSDKACLPNNVYGATKLIGERMALNGQCAVVRLGNLIGSSGSVFAKWKTADERGESIAITDPDMTRFFITTAAAAKCMIESARAGAVIVPQMRAITMGKVASLWKDNRIIGARDGERTHEWAIAPGTRANLCDKAFVLGQGEIMPNGYRSNDAEQWSLPDFAGALAAVQCLPSGAEPSLVCG